MSDLVDQHGANDLTNNNAATFVTGKVGNAAQFVAASNQYLSIASNADLQTGNIDFTLAAWVKLASKPGSGQGIVSKSSGTLAADIEYNLDYLDSSDRFRFTICDGITHVVVVANNFGAVPLDTYCWVVGWHDSVANTINVQVNNGTLNSAAHNPGAQVSNKPLEIGRCFGATARNMDGVTDEVGLWKRVLTADERTELYNGGSGRDYAYISGAGAGVVHPLFSNEGIQSAIFGGQIVR